jgi:hypothetical protein
VVFDRCFLSGAAIDAIHAHLALLMGREMRVLGYGPTSLENYTADRLTEDVRRLAAAEPTHDSCWVAATYAHILARNLYKDLQVSTALMVAYVVLARDNRVLIAPEAELLTAGLALKRRDFDRDRFATGLRRRSAPRRPRE